MQQFSPTMSAMLSMQCKAWSLGPRSSTDHFQCYVWGVTSPGSTEFHLYVTSFHTVTSFLCNLHICGRSYPHFQCGSPPRVLSQGLSFCGDFMALCPWFTEERSLDFCSGQILHIESTKHLLPVHKPLFYLATLSSSKFMSYLLQSCLVLCSKTKLHLSVCIAFICKGCQLRNHTCKSASESAKK